MPRKSQWDDNDAMWAWVAKMRSGGMSLSDIHGKLTFEKKASFGLIAVPSIDTLRYNLKRRVLLQREASPLPPEELIEHRGVLAYIGKVLRRKISPPTSILNKGSVPNNIVFDFSGFNTEPIGGPSPRTESEEDADDEWQDSSKRSLGPDVFGQYEYLRQHLDCTLVGRKVNNALDAVKRTTTEYNTERQQLLTRIMGDVESAFAKILPFSKARIAGALFQAIEPTEKFLTGKSKLTGRLPSADEALRPMVVQVLGSLTTSKANADLSKTFRRMTTAQRNLKASLSPEPMITKMVRDSECDICTAKPLDRAVQ
jgi:hypothetical protein